MQAFFHKHLIHLLIGINVAVFLLQMLLPSLTTWGALWLPAAPVYAPWQWLTHMFLHDGILHLLFNMYALSAFGEGLLAVWGVRRFCMLYFGGGLAGALLYSAWQWWQFDAVLAAAAQGYGMRPTELLQAWYSGNTDLPPAAIKLLRTYALGASGAAFALLAAFSLRFADVRLGLWLIPLSFPARYFVAALVCYELFAQISGVSLFGSGIAHMAHIGGALSGWLWAWWWLRRPRRARLRLVK